MHSTPFSAGGDLLHRYASVLRASWAARAALTPAKREPLERQFLPAAAVLFVSGYTAGSFPNSADDPAANVFLQKPFTPQELLAMVRQVLDRHAADRESRNAITAS